MQTRIDVFYPLNRDIVYTGCIRDNIREINNNGNDISVNWNQSLYVENLIKTRINSGHHAKPVPSLPLKTVCFIDSNEITAN